MWVEVINNGKQTNKQTKRGKSPQTKPNPRKRSDAKNPVAHH